MRTTIPLPRCVYGAHTSESVCGVPSVSAVCIVVDVNAQHCAALRHLQDPVVTAALSAVRPVYVSWHDMSLRHL